MMASMTGSQTRASWWPVLSKMKKTRPWLTTQAFSKARLEPLSQKKRRGVDLGQLAKYYLNSLGILASTTWAPHIDQEARALTLSNGEQGQWLTWLTNGKMLEGMDHTIPTSQGSTLIDVAAVDMDQGFHQVVYRCWLILHLPRKRQGELKTNLNHK